MHKAGRHIILNIVQTMRTDYIECASRIREAWKAKGVDEGDISMLENRVVNRDVIDIHVSVLSQYLTSPIVAKLYGPPGCGITPEKFPLYVLRLRIHQPS